LLNQIKIYFHSYDTGPRLLFFLFHLNINYYLIFLRQTNVVSMKQMQLINWCCLAIVS